jgi:hypothetical protein
MKKILVMDMGPDVYSPLLAGCARFCHWFTRNQATSCGRGWIPHEHACTPRRYVGSRYKHAARQQLTCSILLLLVRLTARCSLSESYCSSR